MPVLCLKGLAGQLFNNETEGLVYLVWQFSPQARLSKGVLEGAHSFPQTLELLYLAVGGTKIQSITATLLECFILKRGQLWGCYVDFTDSNLFIVSV